MNNLIILGIFLISLLFGIIKYLSISDNYKDSKTELKFIELWNCTFNFFITGLIGYFFVAIRLPLFLEGHDLGVIDLFLFGFFLLGIFGHLNVFSKNMADTPEVVIKKFLGK